MQAKRWLSGLVACAMLVTMLPTQVFALESDAADTWSKTLNAEELYALIQDKLDENGSIGLADLADSEAGTDTNDGVQGTLTAVAFDSGDKIELSALADGDTSYTLTFTDDDTSEPDSGLPAETGDMTEPPQEDGQPVAPGATPADDSTASDTTSGTDPPTAEEPSAQGQEGTVDLRVTTQETYATEAEADAQAAEQGKDPEADVAVQTDEATGTVLGALLTVDEEQVDAVTLYYTADETGDAPAAQPDNAISTMRWPDQPEYSRTYTINVGESEDISGGAGWYAHDHQWQSSAPSVVSVRKDPHAGYKATITGESVGDATIITHTWKTGIIDIESHQEQFLVNVTQKSYGEVTFKVYYIIGDEPDDLAAPGDAENYGPASDNTPLVHLTVDIDKLLKTYSNGLRSDEDGTWYITYRSCGVSQETWWQDVLDCITDGKDDLEATGLSDLFEGYVLKKQNGDEDDQYHLDGTVDLQPPVYSAELHLDETVVRTVMASGQPDRDQTKAALREAYTEAIKKTHHTDEVTWYAFKQDSVVGFFVADDGTTYLLKEEGTNDPEQSILGNETVKFTKKSNLYHVASFYLTIEEAPATVTAEDVIGSFYKRLDMGDQSVREPYLEEAFEGGDTFSFKLSKLVPNGDEDYAVDEEVATATVTFDQRDILNSIGDNGTTDQPYLFKQLTADDGIEETLQDGYYILQEDFVGSSTIDKQVQNNNPDLSWKNANGERKGEHGYIIQVESGEVTYKPNMEEDSVIINDVYKFKTLENTEPTKVYSENDAKEPDKFNNVFENDFASYSVTYNWGEGYMVSGAGLPESKYYSEGATVIVENFKNGVYATKAGQTYKFTGWTTDVTVKDDGTFIMPDQNVTLTAQWEPVNTVNELLSMFQKTAVLGAGSDSSVQAPQETFTFTLTKDGEQTATATATATVKNWNTPTALTYTPDVTTQVLNGDISTEIPMLEDGTYTLTETLTQEQVAQGWTTVTPENGYTITITNGEMTVTGGTQTQGTWPYTFTNTYTEPVSAPDLKDGDVVKTSDASDGAAVGETVTYTVTTTFTESGTIDKITLDDTVVNSLQITQAYFEQKSGDKTTFLHVENTWNAENKAFILTNDVVVNDNDRFVVEYTYTLPETLEGSEKFTNSATVRAYYNNVPGTPDTGEETIKIVPGVPKIWSVVKVAAGDHHYAPGETVTYSITTTFAEDGQLDKFTVEDSFFPYVSNICYWFKNGESGVVAQSAFNGNVLTVDLGAPVAVTANSTLTISYQYTIPENQSAGGLTNTATVTVSYKGVGETHDPVTETVTVEEPKPELSIEKALTKVNGEVYTSGKVNSGDVLTYQITIANTGNADARGDAFNVTDSMWQKNITNYKVMFTDARNQTSDVTGAYPLKPDTFTVQMIPAHTKYVVTYDYTVDLSDEGTTLSNTVRLTGQNQGVDLSDTVEVDVEKTHCLITYTYESGTADKELPDEGLPQVPGSETVTAGTTLSLPGVDPSTVKTEDGTWTFLGWYYNGSLINPPVVVRDDMDIVGLWKFEENQYANLTVTLVSGEDNGNYGLAFSGLEPQTAPVQIGTAYSIVFEGEGTISVPTTLDVSGINYVYDEAATKALNASENPLSGTMPGEDIEVKVAYSIDILGGEDPENPGDGIPDQYQFTIEYVVADGQEAMGSVSPVGQNVYTIYQDGVLSAGPVTVSIDGDVIKAGVATAQDGYVFENWTLNDVDLSAIGVDDDLTGYQMMGVTGGQTYTFIAHFTKNYTVQDVLYSFVKEVTLADGVENFPASAEFKFALTKEGGSPTYEATTGEVSGMTAEKPIPIVTDATDILADGTYYLTETVMDAGWTLTTPADGYKITIDHGTMSVNDEQVTEGETFAFVNTYNGAPSLEVEKTVVDAKGNPVSDDAVYRDGDQVYFKIAVTAKGGWPVEDVTVTDTLPAGLTVDAQAIQYPEFHNFRGSLTNVDGKTVEIRINTATPTEDTVWVIIPAIVDTPETYDADAYTNIAVIDDGDPDTEDPSGETTIQVEAVSVVKALTPNSPYNIGQTAQYYIVVTNTGNTVLNNLTVTEQLPEGLQLTDSEVNAGWNDGVYTIDFLNPGDSYQIWAEVQIMDYAESYPNVVVVKDSEETDLGQAEDDTLEVNPNHTVTVRYEWQDASGVTVGNETKATLEAAHDSRWKASVSDDTSQTLTDAADLVVAKMFTVDGKQYAFKGFAPAQTSGSVAGDVTITAVYGLDETGTTTDPEKPDGIPDEYQATVTYRVVNGTWSDGSSTDRTEVFTLYTYDPDTAAWTELEHVTLGDTIPTGMQANAGYVGQSGAWNTAITAETQVTGNVTYIYRFGEAAPNEIIVYYDDDGSGYGEVTSDHRQVFTAEDWQTITGDPTHVRIHLTATAEDDGGRTYFDEWQGSLVDDLDDDIREDEELSAWVVAEIGQTYTVIADFGRRSSGGGGGGGGNRDDDDEEEIIDEEVPLAETPWLNTVDHYAYIVGYAEDGTVRPNANITRAEVATIFFRLLTDEARNSLWSTTNTFSDVASTVWYNTAVSTMANAGIIQGYEDGTFRPNANITRAEFAAIAARFMTSGYDVESDLFTDIAGHWARESINDAATAGWINGYSDDTFRPDNAITRAEAVTLVNNVLQRKPDADHMLDSMITWPDNPESAWYYEAIQEATNSHDYDMPSEDDDVDYETWTALQENRDWAALEAQWSAEHAYGGDVM